MCRWNAVTNTDAILCLETRDSSGKVIIAKHFDDRPLRMTETIFETVSSDIKFFVAPQRMFFSLISIQLFYDAFKEM